MGELRSSLVTACVVMSSGNRNITANLPCISLLRDSENELPCLNSNRSGVAGVQVECSQCADGMQCASDVGGVQVVSDPATLPLTAGTVRLGTWGMLA